MDKKGGLTTSQLILMTIGVLFLVVALMWLSGFGDVFTNTIEKLIGMMEP